MVGKMCLIEKNMSGDVYSGCERIKASVAFVLQAVAQKDTLNTFSIQLGGGIRFEPRITATSKDFKHRVIWRLVK